MICRRYPGFSEQRNDDVGGDKSKAEHRQNDQAGRNDQQAACGAEQMMTVEVFAGLGDEDIAERQGDQGDRTGHETGGDAKMPRECGTE